MYSSLSLGLVLLPFASAAVHNIKVGDNGALMFSPEAIAAQPGDQVIFEFRSKNHTVTQSSFPSPCGAKEGGFDSGFNPVPANQTSEFPTYTVTVPDTQPIWVHCKQTNPVAHCGKGMVFAINCGADGAPNSFTNFKNSALAIGAAEASAAAPSPSAAGGYGGYGGYGGSGGSVPPANGAVDEWTTAAYGGYSIPVAPQATPVTQTITLGEQVWTTTYNSYPGSPDPTPVAAEGTIHKVIVGGSQTAFDPPSIQAKPRDIVVFEFHQKNHSVTQSSFADPCRPLNANGAVGFDSGFTPVAPDVSSSFPTWNLTINDTAPIWAYCRQIVPASHCGLGMVFAINAVESSSRNFQAFQNVAKAINGSAAADAVPSPSSGVSTTTGANGAAPVRLSTATVTIAAALFISLLL